ncbi:MAG: TIGR02147 family protein [Bdellovibrionales bacterium]|nr:TIGR02147 family protein [Bdellovibrionales bacterium]
MRKIHGYTNFRQFLKDFYEEKKLANPSYSYRFFAKKAGINSPNYFKLVMDGQRNLTHRNVKKFAKGLGLQEQDAHYFENLVFYNQATDDEERLFFQKNLELIRSHDERTLLGKEHYEVLSSWYPLAIKELLLFADDLPTPKWIAKKFDYRITPMQAKEALELLLKLKLITLEGKNTYKVTNQSLQTPDTIVSQAATHFHKAVLDLAKSALDEQRPNERCFSSLTLALNKKDLVKASQRIHAFRNEMDTYFSKRTPFDSVYQLSLQFFRLDFDD